MKGLIEKQLARAGGCFLAASSLINPTFASAPLHHDQTPSFYRLKVGDFEITALFDGQGTIDPHWLVGSKALMDGVAKAVSGDPRILEGSETGFLINTGKQLILVDAGAGSWFLESLGHLVESLRSAGYKPEDVDVILPTHLHSDHIGGLTTKEGKVIFPNATVYVSATESDFWLSKEVAARAPKEAQPFFQVAQAISMPYLKAGKWITYKSGSEPVIEGLKFVSLPGHTPGHTGYEFSSNGKKLLVWGDIIHAQKVQLTHPELTVVFDVDPKTAAATRKKLLSELASEDIVIAGAHMAFPSLGRIHKDNNGYNWNTISFSSSQWDEKK